MIENLEYAPGIGTSPIRLNGLSAVAGAAFGLRSREWDYDLGYRDLVNAMRPARTVSADLVSNYETANTLRRAADADVAARKPGTFVFRNEWRQKGYIFAAQPKKAKNGWLSTGLTIALLDGAWWRLVKRSFVPEITTPEYRSATGETVTASGASGAPLDALTVDGKAVQDGTPTPSSPVPVEVVEPVDGVFGISVNGVVTPIDLQGNVLASLPDGTKDVLTVDSTGAVTLEKHTHVWNMRDYATSTNWLKSGSAINGFYLSQSYAPIHKRSTHGNAKCNVATAQNSVQNYFNTINSCYIDTNFNFNLDAAVVGSTIQDFKAWLANNDLFMLAELATPQTINLGTIDMPAVPLDAQISVTAAATPSIMAEWQISRDAYLDYPHNYPHDYQATSSTADVTPSVLTPSDVYLAVYGPAVNPYVIVGGNRYQVNVTVPSGGYLVVDGRDKTINLTLADGTVQNVFSSGVRGGGAGGGSYIFERVPAGTSEVTYDGSFGFDLGWYEEEGEPPWSQS